MIRNVSLGVLLLVLCLPPRARAEFETEGLPGGDTFLGVIDYQGGFVRDAALKVAAPQIAKFYRVAIPAFCKDVEIVEASTITEGVKDISTIMDKDKNIFAVNNGAGSRISTVLLTLNGPFASKCNIPIFLSEGAHGPVPPPTPIDEASLRLCNRNFAEIWAAVGYPEGDGFATEGWFLIPARSCRTPETQAKLLGAIYVYAYAKDGRQWGEGANICVLKGSGTFKATSKDCQAATPGYELHAFTPYTLEAGTILRIDFKR